LFLFASQINPFPDLARRLVDFIFTGPDFQETGLSDAVADIYGLFLFFKTPTNT
jgi:hypothetical protein